LAGDKSKILIENKAQLVEYMESGNKPEARWRLGTEHEKFGFCRKSFSPLPYEGDCGIRSILEGLAEQFDWRPVYEHGKPIALLDDTGASVTLEPGGQLELSGALLDTIHDTCREVNIHLKQVKAVSESCGASFLGMGFQPKMTRDDIEWMPKGRYKIMSNYMPKVGSLGIDMMTRTCTVQVNLDFSSEADMVQKFRTSLALQPIAPTLRLLKANPVGMSATGHTSGKTPTLTVPACNLLYLKVALALSDMWITCWMCPCILYIAEMSILMSPDSLSEISWKENYPASRVNCPA
jgi:glutamate--cysteine ligase